MKVYVASSWRCAHQPAVVEAIREAGHEVYDFRHPAPGNEGFAWSDIDPDWLDWTPDAFRTALDNPIAEGGFGLDMAALRWCDACVLVLQCGRSAHLELGWACGAGKLTIAYIPEPSEPELMYKMLDGIATSLAEVLVWLGAGKIVRVTEEPERGGEG